MDISLDRSGATEFVHLFSCFPPDFRPLEAVARLGAQLGSQLLDYWQTRGNKKNNAVPQVICEVELLARQQEEEARLEIEKLKANIESQTQQEIAELATKNLQEVEALTTETLLTRDKMVSSMQSTAVSHQQMMLQEMASHDHTVRSLELQAHQQRKQECQLTMSALRHQQEVLQKKQTNLSAYLEEFHQKAIALDRSLDLFDISPDGTADRQNIVLVGNTGDGKSTLANRLFGDDSRRGNQGPFKVSGSAQSETSKVHSEIFDALGTQFCLVDTPGMSDSAGKMADLSHANLLVSYLRGVSTIQGFIFVRNFGKTRLSHGDIVLLQGLSDLLGRQFWDNVMLVFTRVDDEDDEEDMKESGSAFVDLIRREFNLNTSDSRLPMIGIGKRNFVARRHEILAEALNFDTPFSCEHLVLPLDELKKGLADLQTEKKSLEVEIKKNELQIDRQNKIINLLDERIQSFVAHEFQ